MADAVPMDDPTPFTEEQVERAIAFAIEPFLRHEIKDGNWTDQAFSDVSRECARIAVATINNCSKHPAREK